MDTLDEIHGANIHTLRTTTEDITLEEALKWKNKKSEACVFGDYHMQFNQTTHFAHVKGFSMEPKASLSSWISAGIVTFLYRFC